MQTEVDPVTAGAEIPHRLSREGEAFLIEVYAQTKETFRRNEEMGETRLGFFITISAIVFAALTTLKPDGLLLAYFGVVLLFFGWLTRVRILRRNQASDDLKVKLVAIERYFNVFEPIARFLPFGLSDPRPRKYSPWSLDQGGLRKVVEFSNSVIVGVIAVGAAQALSVAAPSAAALAVGFALCAWLVQHLDTRSSVTSEDGLPAARR